MKARLSAETAGLLTDVARYGREREESSEERLLRLTRHPLALHRVLNERPLPPVQPASIEVPGQATITYCLSLKSGETTSTPAPYPARVLHGLGARAPAVARPTYKEEEFIMPFTPSQEDQQLAIEIVPAGRYLLGLAVAAAVTTALALGLFL